MESSTKNKREIVCQIHESKPILYSCKLDGDILCQDCFENHKEHEDRIVNLDLEKL